MTKTLITHNYIWIKNVRQVWSVDIFASSERKSFHLIHRHECSVDIHNNIHLTHLFELLPLDGALCEWIDLDTLKRYE